MTTIARRAATTVATILAALVVAQPAAATPVPASPADTAMIARYTPVADAAWPNSPCAGRIAVTFDDDLATTLGHPGTIGGAAPDCHVLLQSRQPDLQMCTALVHEYGHEDGRMSGGIDGLGHDATGIMAPSPKPWPPCYAAIPQLPVTVLARQALNRSWPRRWTCTRATTRAVRCRSEKLRAVVRIAPAPVPGAAPIVTGSFIVFSDYQTWTDY